MSKKHVPEPDPRSRFEDEGIPDLQDGTPGQRWSVDPQEAPLPGDEPVAIEDHGTTVEEQIQGESLDGRLRREVPEDQPGPESTEPGPGSTEPGGGTTEPGGGTTEPGGGTAEPGGGTAGPGGGSVESGTGVDEREPTEESGLGVGSELDTTYEPGPGVEEEWSAQPEEPSGQVWDEPRRAGRLVAPDEGVRADAEPDEVAGEVGPDAGGYSAEETAMRVEPE
ncbi:MAG: hypothetical protein GEV11_22000 [Streptosporangiales bacterium]|nr:hypothetical protein [Streptosporangiales bacterium]